MSRSRLYILVPCLMAIWMLLPGCAHHQSKAKVESLERWNRTRAQVKMKLATEHLKAGHVEDAATELVAAFRLDPDNPRLRAMQARVQLARGELEEAWQTLEDIQTDEPFRAEVEYLRGIIQEQYQRWQRALKHYSLAADSAPGEVAYVVAIVQVLLQQGQADQALELLVTHEEQFGWTSAYQAALAECHEQMNNWSAAVAAWRMVVDANNAPDIRERLATALFRTGRESEAIVYFESLLAEGDTRPMTSYRLALAHCLFADDQAAAAREQINSVLQENPRNIAGLQLLARVFAKQGYYERALQVGERILRMAPEDPQALELTATLSLRAGDSDRALVLARQISELSPETENPIAAAIMTKCGTTASAK